MEKSFDFCNKCRKIDNGALIHCAVCSYPYHVKCIAPKLTVKACDDLIANNNFHFYCDDHSELCVHKLLNRISKLERKFRTCVEPLNDISNELDKHQQHLNNSGYNIGVKPNTKDAAVSTSPTREMKMAEVTVPNSVVEKRGSLNSNVTIRHRQNKNNKTPVIHNIDHNQDAIILPDSDVSDQLVTVSVEIPRIEEHREPPTLVCVSPRKAVFLSGFDPNTSTEDIMKYIEFYIHPGLNINVRKMKFHEKSRSAVFVIYVGTDEAMFNRLCDNNFWPRHANCREYEFFRNRQEPHRSFQGEKIHTE
jgi:hypothetical protein